MSLGYENPPANVSIEQVRAMIEGADSSAAAPSIIGLALYHCDGGATEALLSELSTHPDEVLRGNAVLGLGHLARRGHQLSPESLAAVAQALASESEYVRGQATAASEDIEFFQFGCDTSMPHE